MITALTPEEAARWLDAAPEAVQAVVTSDATAKTVGAIAAARQFHVDQSGLLVNLVSYLLVGYVSPQQAEDALVEAGVSAPTARAVLTEVNQKIFVPLQAQMRAGAQAPARPAVPPPPRYAPPPPPPPARAPMPQAAHPQMPPTPARPPVRFNETPTRTSVAHAPIMNPERELPVGEPAAKASPGKSDFPQMPNNSGKSDFPPAPAPTHPVPPPARPPVPTAMHEAPPTPPAPRPPLFPAAPLPPRGLTPGNVARPTPPAVSSRSSASASAAPALPGPPAWRPQKAAPPPANLPGTGAPAAQSYAADPYREPIE